MCTGASLLQKSERANYQAGQGVRGGTAGAECGTTFGTMSIRSEKRFSAARLKVCSFAVCTRLTRLVGRLLSFVVGRSDQGKLYRHNPYVYPIPDDDE